MNLDDLISELIGAMANTVVTNKSGTISTQDLADILNRLGIETSEGDSYHNPHALVRKAYDYFSAKGDQQTAANIKAVFVLNDGTPVIR